MTKVLIFCGMGAGDEGKGSVVDAAVRKFGANTVVRFNGGSQAAHNVVDSAGRSHTFSQFGSGTFTGAQTYLSRFMLVNPFNLMTEAAHLKQLGLPSFDHLTIDRHAPVITPYHVALNRARELSRGSRHGSCGEGIGETQSDLDSYGADMLCVGDLRHMAVTISKLKAVAAAHMEDYYSLMATGNPLIEKELKVFRHPEETEDAATLYGVISQSFRIVEGSYHLAGLLRGGVTVFEGAQGVLLDQDYGFHPYTTWSHTTFQNALTLLSEANFGGDVEKLGILRSYATRHGAGPFVTESVNLTNISPGEHNSLNDWQGSFRSGYFDMVAARYAIQVANPDALVLTHADRIEHGLDKMCVAYTPAYEDEQGESYCFVGDNYRSLRPGKGVGDLHYQEQLASVVAGCEPVYEPVDPREYIEKIEHDLSRDIVVLSSGPTAADKEWFEWLT